MPLPEAEIRKRLDAFAERWRSWTGNEESGKQPYLTELLDCYGVEWKSAGVTFEHRLPSGRKADMLWPGVCLVEMKGPTHAAKLTEHYRDQALPYWNESGAVGQEPPGFIVICSFNRLQVWRPGFVEPEAELDLEELPDRYAALGFLAGIEPEFDADRAELTRDAVELVTEVFRSLEERDEQEPNTLRDFVLQCVWCLFAEDFGLLPHRAFTRLLDRLLADSERSSEDELGSLFEILNRPGDKRPEHGLYRDVPWANGELFERPARVHLLPEDVERLREAARFDWRLVEPAIFGFMLEGALGHDKQWRFGAHYTSERDIMKVVGPTVVEPWLERLARCDTLEEVAAAQDDLAAYEVLDPACGSGNFLYVAYRELRKIEVRLADRERDLRRASGLEPTARMGLFGLQQLHGIEREPFALRLARVTLWMGHAKTAADLGLDDKPLALESLPHIRLHDALKAQWPQVQAIVGNPPYHGSQRIRKELGDDYAEDLREMFGIGLKDYAVYWFRKAHAALPDDGRAGFVATNSISQNRNRGVSLDWIVENGGVIVNAVSSQDWPGLAAVDVSIVNWVKNPSQPPLTAVLNDAQVAGITPSLRPVGVDLAQASRLPQNAHRAFQGPIPAGSGFIIDVTDAERLLSQPEAEYFQVVRPYLIGDDITTHPLQEPTRWVIDFAFMALEEARRFPAALDVVREHVKPTRDVNRDRGFRDYWWRFGRPRGEMRAAIAPLSRYVAANAQGKRIHFTWQQPTTCPSNSNQRLRV